MNHEHSIPTLFVSHGAPDILLSHDESSDAIRNLSAQVPRPKAIVVISAHWIDDPVGITDMENPTTIHDFGGFQPELYQQQYPAKGDATLSRRIASLLQEQGMQTHLQPNRGLDHGAWIPLMMMYPEPDIPVVQVSLPASTLDQLVKLGKALRPLRREGVLIIGSGGSVHNLREMKRSGSPEPWAIEFEGWLKETIEGKRFNDLITAANYPASFRRAHPTIEHFVPLVAAWSAGGHTRQGKRLHHSFCYGNLGMSHYLFE